MKGLENKKANFEFAVLKKMSNGHPADSAMFRGAGSLFIFRSLILSEGVDDPVVCGTQTALHSSRPAYNLRC